MSAPAACDNQNGAVTISVSSRTTIENAAQSVLQLAAARPDKQIQARLIRAKARLAAGMRGAAHQGGRTSLFCTLTNS